MQMIRTLLNSKKFVAALASGLFVLLNETLAIGITEETITQLIGLAAAYVIGQGIADLGKEVKA
tara:strand:- start:54909 stop:55100 length:192 start_codon:yes stop_codon:yes gene_type:complete